MSDLKKYIEFVRKWEGSHGRSIEDSSSRFPCPTPFKGQTGWHTSSGVAYKTWVSEYGTKKDAEFFSMPEDMWWKIFKKRFWNKVNGDSFNFGVAVLMTDAAWMSGPSVGIELLQDACNVLGSKIKDDGDMGPKTIAAGNSHDPQALFDEMIKLRARFYKAIAVGKNQKWYKGWMNRLNDINAKFRP
jgi:lysozyme family protein